MKKKLNQNQNVVLVTCACEVTEEAGKSKQKKQRWATRREKGREEVHKDKQ